MLRRRRLENSSCYKPRRLISAASAVYWPVHQEIGVPDDRGVTRLIDDIILKMHPADGIEGFIGIQEIKVREPGDKIGKTFVELLNEIARGGQVIPVDQVAGIIETRLVKGDKEGRYSTQHRVERGNVSSITAAQRSMISPASRAFFSRAMQVS